MSTLQPANLPMYQQTSIFNSQVRKLHCDCCVSLTRQRISHTPPLFALIIGINKYKSFAVTTLKGAVPDANSVQQYLEKELNVPSSHIRNLRNEEATRAAIVDAFRQLQDDSRIKNGDPILIFYAGHGGEVDAPVGWEAGDTKTQMLVPHDFRTKVNNRDVHGIPDRTIAALLDRLSEKKGDNIVCLAACPYIFLC